MAIRAYTVTEGLAHDHVSRIYRDSHDFLWICTDEGLSRFDGRRFVNYTIANGLPHIHVNDVIETRGGDYWVATDGGLTLFQPAHPAQRFTIFKPDGPPEALFVNAVLEESDGAVLAGTGAGLYRLRRNARGAKFERIDFAPPSRDPSVHTLYIDRNGALWLGATSGLYQRGAGGQWRRFAQAEGLPNDFVGRINADPGGRIWVCTRHGLARLAETIDRPGGLSHIVDLVLTNENGLPHRDVRAIHFTPDGRRWIAAIGGLVEWDPGAPAASAFRVYSKGFTDREIYAVAADVDGNLWAGSRRGGLMRLSRPEFEAYGESDGLAFSATDDIVESRSGNICVAALSDPRRSIRCFEAGRFHLTIPRLPPDVVRRVPNPSHSTFVDHAGDWWIASPEGLFRFRFTPAAAPDPRLLAALGPRRLYDDSHSNLWITTMRANVFGLRLWERATSRVRDLSGQLPDVVRQRGITAITEAPAGQMWFGLGRPGGLLGLRDERFEEVPGAPAGTIQALYRDSSGRVWMASAEAGLGRIDQPASAQPAVRLYKRSHGLASNEVWSLTEDRQGRIYAGTARGVDRLDPASGRITHYTQANGLSGDIRAAHRDQRGDLWFLSNRGLFRLRPGTDAPRRALPVKIMNIRVEGGPHAISEIGETKAPPAEFEARRNSIEIEFSAIDFQTPDQVRYQFWLRGGAEGWSDPSPNSTVHFSNLAPGRYEFFVRAINADGLPSATPASFAFTIAPPLWLRWWFQSILALAMLGLTYLWYRLRLNRQLALERVRSHIATDLHDDIGASLSRIAVMSEVVKGRVSAADDDSRRMLADVAETSRALVDGMSDIVWSIDPRRDNLGDVVARLRAFGSDVLETRGIRWACEDGSADGRQGLSPDQRRQLYLIFKEAIHNIARHSSAANVILRIGVRDNRLWAEIEDDGCGIPSGPSTGLGLDSMRGRADRLGGIFEIHSRPQGGTRASLGFPL